MVSLAVVRPRSATSSLLIASFQQSKEDLVERFSTLTQRILSGQKGLPRWQKEWDWTLQRY